MHRSWGPCSERDASILVLNILQCWKGDQREFVWCSVESAGSEEQGGWHGWDAGPQNECFSSARAQLLQKSQPACLHSRRVAPGAGDKASLGWPVQGRLSDALVAVPRQGTSILFGNRDRLVGFMLCCGAAAPATLGSCSPLQGARLDLNVSYCCEAPAGIWCLTRALPFKASTSC